MECSEGGSWGRPSVVPSKHYLSLPGILRFDRLFLLLPDFGGEKRDALTEQKSKEARGVDRQGP